MELIDIPTEQTTAATDLLLAAVAGAGIVLLRRPGGDPWKARLWVTAFAGFAIASLLGALAHGLKLAPATTDLLWRLLNLTLGLTVALFVVAAVYDHWGQQVAQRTLPLLLAVGLGFFLTTQLRPGSFRVFVLYEAVALLIALLLYVRLALVRRMPGAGAMICGILLSLLAAAVQTRGTVAFTLIWPFDHNGAFHLIQMLGLVALLWGIRSSIAGAAGSVASAIQSGQHGGRVLLGGGASRSVAWRCLASGALYHLHSGISDIRNRRLNYTSSANAGQPQADLGCCACGFALVVLLSQTE